MTNIDATQAIEDDIRNAKAVVETRDALLRLKTNRDFQTIFMKGYLEKESIRLVMLKANPNVQVELVQKRIIADIDAIGSFYAYMNKILSDGDQAETYIDSANDTLSSMDKNMEEHE